jgi:hypothetical protein
MMQKSIILCHVSQLARQQTKLIGTLGLIFSLMAVSLFSLVSPVYAAGTIDVNATADAFGGGTCSLRNAIESANTDTNFGGCTRTGTPPYTINVPAGTYILTIAGQNEDVNATGDLDIRAAMDIVGAGSGTTLLQGTPSVPIPLPVDRILHIVNPVTVNFSGVTLRYGLTEVDGNGGGISNSGGGSLHLTNSLIAANGAQGVCPGQGGGGLYNVVTGTLTLSNTNVISNGAIIGSGNGGGILNAGTLQITGGSIAENRANRAGGGVENNGGTATFTNLAMTSNTVGSAPGNGGALHTSCAGVVTMNGCSVLSNTAAAEGGGLWNSAGGTMTVNNVTMSGNIAS